MDSENNGLNGRDDKGKFIAGNPGKPKGAMINATKKVKETIVAFLEYNIEEVQESFDKLKPIEKLQFITALLPYVVPKLSSVQNENQTKLSGGISIRWSDPGIHNTGNKGSNGELQRIQEGIPDNLQPGGDQVGEDLHP